MKVRSLMMIFFLSLLPFSAQLQGQSNNEIFISAQPEQQMQLGIDAERLQPYWHMDIATPLAEMGVNEMQSDYVRVAVNCAYELEQGKKNPEAYDNILHMMTAMKRANPNIKFFASPRPLWVAHGTKNGIPWTPYPVWIQEWEQNGTTEKDGKEYPKWKKGDFHVDRLVKYYADYLNLMHDKGFRIDFLDLSNEQSIIKPVHAKFIKEELPGKLNPGVHMPKLITPSTWSIRQGTEWLQLVDREKGEHLSFEIASAHNTGGDFEGEEFASEAQKLHKEIWNTEMHKWMGVDTKDEILSSDILWKHIRAGFNGINTWLTYGPYQGRGHTMIWVDPEKGIRKSTKYEIFKKLVNTSNRGYYLSSTSVHDNLITVAFVKDKDLTIWVLNMSDSPYDEVIFNLSDLKVASTIVEQTIWNEMTPRAGNSEIIVNSTKTKLSRSIAPESLYFFKLTLEESLVY